jgi:glutamyl-tRNA synthetase/glutamyl-Q tRNA(Asp) synthetase
VAADGGPGRRGGPARGGATRFAPAPTGYLHLGHVVNAIHVWGWARATGRRVVLRIEDHDRQRSRPAFEAALLEDLAWLGFVPDAGPYRQSEDGPVYATALETLRFNSLVYACTCSRATFAAWAAEHGAPWRGPGCPGGCRSRGLDEGPDVGVRVALPAGDETWTDLLRGPQRDAPAREGDLLARDRLGNWTYPFCAVVDDLRQGIDLVVRGEDLLDATAPQIRLGRLLGRTAPPEFLHHPLVRKSGGAKLSKADGDTGVRDLRAAGQPAVAVIGHAAAAVGLIEEPRDLDAEAAMTLIAAGGAPS